MRHTVAILLIFSSISGCNWLQQAESPSPNNSKTANCPKQPSEPPAIEVNDRTNIYNAFNYQTKTIVADPDAIAFESLEHKFTWCRANDSWTVESLDRSQVDSTNSTEPESELEREIQFKGDTYRYRVELDRQTLEDARQAVFELTTSNSERSQRQTLYTLEQTKQAGAGILLGKPKISEPLIYDDRLFWYVYTYRGEGFGGIATIVSYDPATEKITAIQPPEIATQIINDLAIAGDFDNPTFWIATQLTGEGNPYIPSMGLVAYRPENENYTQGTIDSYRVDNSPIVGAIPTKLYLENETIWVGTGNGICQIDWQRIDREDSWSCWRFALMAELPREELPVYGSLLDDNQEASIAEAPDSTVEVLWWSLKQREPITGRYEIVYQPGMTVEFGDRGVTTWTELYRREYQPPVWLSPVSWVGSDWHWAGDRFVRGLDEVELNLFGGGAMGIGSNEPDNDYIFDHNAIRGDLELLKLTEDASEVKHYSAWVEETSIQPYLTIIPHRQSPNLQPNPLLEIESVLKQK